MDTLAEPGLFACSSLNSLSWSLMNYTHHNVSVPTDAALKEISETYSFRLVELLGHDLQLLPRVHVVFV